MTRLRLAGPRLTRPRPLTAPPQALYALTTKRDFTAAGALLFTCLLSLLLAGFVGLFLRTSALNLLLGGAGAVLFSCYIVYDVQVRRPGRGARGTWRGTYDGTGMSQVRDAGSLCNVYKVRTQRATRGHAWWAWGAHGRGRYQRGRWGGTAGPSCSCSLVDV